MTQPPERCRARLESIFWLYDHIRLVGGVDITNSVLLSPGAINIIAAMS